MERAIRVAICDTDLHHVMLIKEFIKEYESPCDNITLEYQCFFNPADIIASAITSSPDQTIDIYLLDVFMEHFSGIEIAQKIREYSPQSCIVFLASSADYGVEAFQVKAIHYITKPVGKKLFCEALDRCIEHLKRNRTRKMLSFKMSGQITDIPYDDIVFVESRQKYQHIKVLNRTLIMRESLVSLYKQLSDETCFIMPHRSFIASMNYIKRIETENIVMSTGDIIPLPRGSCREVTRQCMEYFAPSQS